MKKSIVGLVCGLFAMCAFGQYATTLNVLDRANTAKNGLWNASSYTNQYWLTTTSWATNIGGLYQWNADAMFTNASEFCMFYDTDAWWITNSLSTNVAFYTIAGGATNPPPGAWGTNASTWAKLPAPIGTTGTNGLGTDFVTRYAAYTDSTNYVSQIQRSFAVRATSASCMVYVTPDVNEESTTTWSLQKSMDNTNWVYGLTFDVTTAQATEFTMATNLTVGDYGYVRLFNVTNNTPTAVRRLGFTFYSK